MGLSLGRCWGLSCQDSLKKQITMVCYDFWAPFEGLLGPTPIPASFRDMPREGSTRPELGGDSGSELSLGPSWGLSCQDSLKKQICRVCFDFWAPLESLLGLNLPLHSSKVPSREGSTRPEFGGDSGWEAAGPCRFVSWGYLLGHLGASWGLSCQDSLKKQI